MSPASRIGLAALGVVLVAAGLALVLHGGSGNAERLGRLAGIMILVGLVLVGVSAFGSRSSN
jgi:hypothetical protein